MSARGRKARPGLVRSGQKPLLVAIVGGSGSGKSWLADKLAAVLSPNAGRLSLDDFYRDRSHLSPARRAVLNFDHPDAIDWPMLERVLLDLRSRSCARVPSYDFANHSRRARFQVLKAKPFLLVDGLWLLRKRAVRKLFAVSIFVASSRTLRLRRRLARDISCRGRTRASVLEQFRRTVEPMHRRYVEPQVHSADLVVPADCRTPEIKKLARLILLSGQTCWLAQSR